METWFMVPTFCFFNNKVSAASSWQVLLAVTCFLSHGSGFVYFCDFAYSVHMTSILHCDVALIDMLVMNFSDIYKLSGLVTSFQQIIDNLFVPLFEVTNDPASHPELHCFLYYVSQLAVYFEILNCTFICKWYAVLLLFAIVAVDMLWVLLMES